MTTYGVTPQGFVIKRLNDILTDLNNACIAEFGVDFDTDPDKPNGQINGIMAEVFANLWETAAAVYDSKDPAKAVGIALTDIAVINFLKRNNAQYSTSFITMVGTPGKIISAAVLQIGTSNPVNVFRLLTDVTIPISGTITNVPVKAVLTGPIAAPAGTLTTILTPLAYLFSVTNPQDAVLGRDYEEDPEFRMRRNNSTLLLSKQIEDALKANLLALPDVVSAQVYSNNMDVADSNGFKPHSIAAVLLGGEDQAIGQTIYNTHTSSIPTNGETEVDIPNNAGILVPIFFYRAEEKPVYLTIVVQQYAGFPGDGVAQIRQNVFDYVTGANNGNLPLYSIGNTVVLSQLYTPINYTPGVGVTAIKAGFAPAPTSIVDLPIAFNQISTFNINNIIVQAV